MKRRPTDKPCPGCKTGQRTARQVCCRSCWKKVPMDLKRDLEAAHYRDARVAAVRRIIVHLTQQPELPLNHE